MAVQQTEKAVVDLKTSLVGMPTDMRLFSLAMRSLYAEKEVSSSSEAGQKFKELRDDTRKDAMVYLKGVLPLSTKFVSSISEFFEYYEELDYDQWREMLPDILQETVGYRELATTMVKMHEDIMVPLKQREDKARVIVCELKNLQEEYMRKKKELEEKADTKRGWALGLAFIPGVNVIASPLLLASAEEDIAEAVAKCAQSKIQEAAAIVISDTLIPALQAFVDGLSKAAGFFSVMEQELRKFESKANKGTKDPKKLFYIMMNKQARDMKSICQGFYAVLPSVRTDFQAIPTDSSDQNYVDKWLEKQKKEIQSRVTIKSLALNMLKALKG